MLDVKKSLKECINKFCCFTDDQSFLLIGSPGFDILFEPHITFADKVIYLTKQSVVVRGKQKLTIAVSA